MCGVRLGTGGRLGQGSLAGVVDLDLQVDGLKHTAHPGLQPVQLSRFALQRPLVLLISAFQLWQRWVSDEGSFFQSPTFLGPTHPHSHLATAAACLERPATSPEPRPAVALPAPAQPAHPGPCAQPGPSLSGTGPPGGPAAAVDVEAGGWVVAQWRPSL